MSLNNRVPHCIQKRFDKQINVHSDESKERKIVQKIEVDSIFVFVIIFMFDSMISCSLSNRKKEC